MLTRKPTPVPVPTPVKKSKPSVQSVKRKHQDSDPESDGDGEGIDFFSLNKEDKLPDIPMAEVPPVASTSEYQSYGGTELEAFQDPSSSHQQTDYQYQYGQPEAAVAPPQADSGQDFINFNGGEDLQLDDEAVSFNDWSKVTFWKKLSLNENSFLLFTAEEVMRQTVQGAQSRGNSNFRCIR